MSCYTFPNSYFQRPKRRTLRRWPPLFLRQLLLAHRGTAFGDTLRTFQGPALATQMFANLRDPNQLTAARSCTLVRALGGGMNNDEEAELNSKISEGLPFSIQWELVPGVPNFFEWQRRFGRGEAPVAGAGAQASAC